MLSGGEGSLDKANQIWISCDQLDGLHMLRLRMEDDEHVLVR